MGNRYSGRSAAATFIQADRRGSRIGYRTRRDTSTTRASEARPAATADGGRVMGNVLLDNGYFMVVVHVIAGGLNGD